MGIIDDELIEVKKLCEHVIPGTKLVSCVRTMVRAQIKRTDFKTVTVCIQFPQKYPEVPLLIELKSKTLSEKLLLGLTNVCEQELNKILGKPQILHLIKFLRKFIDENPLICCYDEINSIKKSISTQDVLKLRQKSSSLVLKVHNGEYYLTSKILIPENYPLSAIVLEEVETNFTPTFYKYMVAQAKEISRKCVEPPLKKLPNQPVFVASPSLGKTAHFFIDLVKRLLVEECQVCKDICFPTDPKLLEKDENSPNHIERVFCGHLFHQGCLLTYLKQPPFGNKKCSKCGQKLGHFKWAINDRVAEARWAHEQARERELQEVTEFFN